MALTPPILADHGGGGSYGAAGRWLYARIAAVSGPAETRPQINVPDHLTADRVEQVSREFTSVYHDLKEQTFGTTTWLQVPLVKTPADMLAFQQIISETRPELIVETGVYVGGSALLFASIQELLGIDGRVIAIDVDLSVVNDRVRDHPHIELIEGSSTDPEIVSRIRSEARGKRVMVDLDADHRAHHVLEELRLYSPLVSAGCYLVVEDGFLGGRPVRPDAVPGPSEALEAWLAEEPPFEVDRWRERYLLTQNPRGYLRREGTDAPPRREPPTNFMIGTLELSRSEEDAEVVTQAAGNLDRAAEQLEAAAGEPDREVESLRRTIGNLARGDRQARVEAELDERRHELTVDNLLREMETQREVLRERNRLLARERAHLRRILDSPPYRLYRLVKGLPGVRVVVARLARRRQAQTKARSAQRARTRRERTERFVEHHRGQ
jgi:cephalosporin hydroxylase